MDRPLHDLRLSVIEACNFRCPYCMPADQVPDDYGFDAASRLSFDEIETLVRGFVRVGVSKLRLTGGEPLLRKRLPELVARLAAIPGLDDIALTTNGSLLAPQARALREAGLHRITVSLDALDPRAVPRRCPAVAAKSPTCWPASTAAQAAGFAPIKLNCVVQRGVNEGQVLPLVGVRARARPRPALHRIHGRRHLQRLAPRTRGAFRRTARPHPRALAAAAAGCAVSRAKSRRVMPSTTAEAKWVSSVR